MELFSLHLLGLSVLLDGAHLEAVYLSSSGKIATLRFGDSSRGFAHAVASSNLMSRRISALQGACLGRNCPYIELQPLNSFLWHLHDRPARILQGKTSEQVFDQCAYGSPSRKATRVQGANVDMQGLSRRCGNSSICSFTQRRHKILRGHRGSEFYTAAHGDFVDEAAVAVSRVFLNSIMRKQTNNLWSYYRGLASGSTLLDKGLPEKT